MSKCIICGSKTRLYKKSNVLSEKLSSFAYASRKTPEYMHWDLYECEKCRILYSDCPNDKKEIFKKYEEASFDSANEADYASRSYIDYLKKYLPYFPKRKSLDIGTGNGSYLLELVNEGVMDIVGVEPSKEPIQQASPLVRGWIVNSPFLEGMFHEDEFDMVSLFQTVEHIPDPVSVFKEVRRILEPNGVFYVICHDYCSTVNKILGFKSPIYDIEHLQILSRKSIYRLMKKAGFKDIQVFAIKNQYPLKYWFKLFPAPDAIKNRLMAFLERNRIGRMMIGINVGNVGVIARK